ncbi:MAG: dihydrofolate reductase [Bacteroidia bacterium]|nr:dihydrofolate reductase [Bacteroidia bacterium]
MSESPEVIIIAALSKNHVIGKDNKLPWSLPGDWKHFKEVTHGYPMIMGRLSAESEDALYSDVFNVVLTSQSRLDLGWPYVVANSFAGALDLVQGFDKVFVIGGQRVFEEALPVANRLELTHVDAVVDGDTFFPDFDQTIWDHDEGIAFRGVEGNSHDFIILKWKRR